MLSNKTIIIYKFNLKEKGLNSTFREWKSIWILKEIQIKFNW